ncbi:hypothetical protein LCGC14_0111910 [marine sediment metagenome]|uniref:Prepilin peptidase CpaA n=2 Tax=root TaxID=1 RepID=A0A7V1BE07_9RHOB|nr:hypothetical protein [Sulfitobacter litoralis]HDZ51539.1 hypothetical protein [Sulfitobacter litoralis]
MIIMTLLIAWCCILAMPHMALFDLNRDGATETFDYDFGHMTIAVAIGALGISLSTIFTDLPMHSRFLMVIIGSILVLGAWIDRVSAWAPDILMMPFCLMIFLVSPEITSWTGAGIAVGLGTALFLICIALWVPQEFFKLKFAPPADLMAIAAPFVLFGVSMETAAIFMITSILLVLALKSSRFAALLSRPEAVADGARDVDFTGKKAVTFLTVMFPVIFVAFVAKNLTPMFS